MVEHFNWLSDLFAFIAVVFQCCMIVFTFCSARYQNNKNRNAIIAVVAQCCMILFSFFSVNYGDAARDYKEPEKPKIKGAIVDINSESVAFVRYTANRRKDLAGRLGIVLYALTIVNRSEEALTVKALKLKFSLGGMTDTIDAYHLNTLIIEGEPVAFIVKRNPKTAIHLFGWEDIGKNIGKGELIQSGGVIKGSAFYIFPTQNERDLKEISESMSLVVVDFRGNSSEAPIKGAIVDSLGQFELFTTPETPVLSKKKK